jgi:uncharacterized membrane protein
MNDYIEELRSYLSPLTNAERFDVIQFYTEYLQDSELATYQQAVSAIGTPKQVARKILADYSIKAGEKDESEAPRSNRSRQDVRTIWLIILAIFSTPITIPIALALFVAIFTIMLGLIIAVFGIGVCFTITGIIAVLVTIIGFIILSTSFWTGIYYIGFGLLVIGVYLLLMPFIKWLLELILHSTSLFFKWLYSNIVTKNRAEKRGEQK